MKTHLLAVLPLALAGCATEPEVAEGISLLPPRQQLIRLSVDMRGVHPSEAELEAFANNPGLYGDYVDRWLDVEQERIAKWRQLYRNTCSNDPLPPPSDVHHTIDQIRSRSNSRSSSRSNSLVSSRSNSSEATSVSSRRSSFDEEREKGPQSL